MPKPFLKWAGGKTRLLPSIAQRLPSDYHSRRHVEPFLGGGAVFFGLRDAGQAARLSDSNAALINAYRALAVSFVLNDLSAHAALHSPSHYKRVRDEFNGHKRQGVDFKNASDFIYLNRTCFNGLWRVNSIGEFNVPIGSYTNPTIYDAPTLKSCAAHLDDAVELHAQNYQHAFEAGREGDFFYLDPPYASADTQASFTGYTADGFDHDDQATLADWCRELDAQGIPFMMSNSDVPLIRELYENFNISRVDRQRGIGPGATEVLITNY